MRLHTLKFKTAICLGLTSSLISQAANAPTPSNDPPDQRFRYAPMPQATRSIVLSLGEIRFAFDTEILRTHTVWHGELDLYGPQHTHAKRPFIAQIKGEQLWGNPPTIPWQIPTPSPKPTLKVNQLNGTFTGVSIDEDKVTLHYDLQFRSDKPIAVQLTPSLGQKGIQRKLTLGPCNQPLWFLANSFAENENNRTVVASGMDDLTVKIISTPMNYTETIVTETGAESAYDTRKVQTVAEQHWVRIPPHDQTVDLNIVTQHQIKPKKNNTSSNLTKLTEVGQTSFRPSASQKNPYYKIESLDIPPELKLFITGMDWLEDGRLAVCTWPGEVYLFKGLLHKGKEVMFQLLANGLNEPMGILSYKGKLYVSQKAELTEIAFDENNRKTRFTRISADWGYSGHYNAFSYGPVLDLEGHFVLANAGHSGRWDMKFMGWGIRHIADGRMEGIASGLREPNGIGTFGSERDIFVTDNQGQWTAACKLNHLRSGQFFGHPSARPEPKKSYKGRADFTPPAVWFPYTLARSVSGMAEVMDERFGPFKGQLLVGDFQNALLARVFLEKVNGNYQGAVFPFLNGFRSGVNRLSYGPDGCLYVGGLQRTWASIAPDPSSLERVSFSGKNPFAIRKVEAKRNGFLLTFTHPATSEASNPDNFDVSQFRYAYQASYGSPRFSHDAVKNSQSPISVSKASLSPSGLELQLTLKDWKKGFVTEIRCFDLMSRGGEELWCDTFHYTLNEIPAP